MVTGNTPFRGDTVSDLKRQVLLGQYSIPDFVSENCQKLINGLLKMEPTERLTLTEIKNHLWMINANFPSAYEKYSSVPSEEEVSEKPTVKEVWDTMDKYGISPVMLKEAAQRGAKNSVIGTYRIVLYQVQTRQQHQDGQIYENSHLSTRKMAKVEELAKKTLPKRTSRLCVIL